VWGHVVAPWVSTAGDFNRRQFNKLRPEGATSGTEADAITSRALNDFVQLVLDEVSDLRHGAFSFGHCRQLARRSS